MTETKGGTVVRRIVYSIGEGLLVIALFTAALSAQNATPADSASVTVVAPPRVQPEGSNGSLSNWQNIEMRNIECRTGPI